MEYITVTQLNNYVSYKLKEDSNLKNINLKGEISDFKMYPSSGHCYFSLKDSDSIVRAVMFANAAKSLDFKPENGMQVTVVADAGLYEKSGGYQIYVKKMYPDGYGFLYEQYTELKNRLENQGIFDNAHKKKLPQYPEKIAVVTSSSGAVFHDICQVVERRYPLCEIVLFPSAVQGNVSDEICNALNDADNSDCDLIILARGGGSFGDLSVFNSESIALTLYNCQKPVISAIGHETDFTIADFSADRLASTPTAAAEIAVPSSAQLYEYITSECAKLEKAINDMLANAEKNLAECEAKLQIYSPENTLKIMQEKFGILNNRLNFAYENIISEKEKLFAENLIKLDNINPLKIMSRGYAVISRNNKMLSDFKSVKIGDELDIRMADDRIKAKITDIPED